MGTPLRQNWHDLGHSGAHESRGPIEYEDIELDIWVMAFIWDVSAYLSYQLKL